MEILLGLVLVIGASIGLAYAIWKSVQLVAKLNGFKKDEMPMHYHFIGIGAYFSIFWLMMYILHISVT